MKPLPLPTDVLKDEKAREVLRAFVLCDGRLVTVHLGDAWEHVATWGILLADTARQISTVAIQQGNDSPLEEIIEMFNAEVTAPTSEISAAIVQEQ
jgi:hypothetical protein